MAIEARAIPLELENGERHSHSSTAAVIARYWALTKPDVNSLVAVTVGIAFCLAATRDVEHFPFLVLLNVLLGTLLVSRAAAS